MDSDTVDGGGGVWTGQHIVADRIVVGGWAEGRAACGDFLDTTLTGFEGDVFRVDERCLEGGEVVAGDAGADPAVVLVDTSGGPQNLSDDVLEIPVGAAAVLEPKIGVHRVEARRGVGDSGIAVDQASHR